MKTKLLATLGALWMRSLRIRLRVPDDFRPGILGLWHKDLLASTAAFKDKNVHILVSESSDGEFFAQAAKQLHYEVTRGSDTHGATNVRHLLKSLKNDRFVGMALARPRPPGKTGFPVAIKGERPPPLAFLHQIWQAFSPKRMG